MGLPHSLPNSMVLCIGSMFSTAVAIDVIATAFTALLNPLRTIAITPNAKSISIQFVNKNICFAMSASPLHIMGNSIFIHKPNIRIFDAYIIYFRCADSFLWLCAYNTFKNTIYAVMPINAISTIQEVYKNFKDTLNFDHTLHLPVSSIGVSVEFPKTGGRIYDEFSIACMVSRKRRIGCFI